MKTRNRLMIGAMFLSAPLLIGGVTTASTPGHPASSLPSRGPPPPHSAAAVGYDITIHTANVNYAGTDGDVYLKVTGTTGSTGYIRLGRFRRQLRAATGPTTSSGPAPTSARSGT